MFWCFFLLIWCFVVWCGDTEKCFVFCSNSSSETSIWCSVMRRKQWRLFAPADREARVKHTNFNTCKWKTVSHSCDSWTLQFFCSRLLSTQSFTAYQNCVNKIQSNELRLFLGFIYLPDEMFCWCYIVCFFFHCNPYRDTECENTDPTLMRDNEWDL